METSPRETEKPAHIAQKYWDASACEKSPTGGHNFFIKGYRGNVYSKKGPDGRCKYCGEWHSDVHPPKSL